MRWTVILIIVVAMITAGCSTNPPVEYDTLNITAEKQHTISSLLLTPEDLEGEWTVLKDYTKTVSGMKKIDTEFQKRLGFKGGYVRKFRSKDDEMVVFQSISVYNKNIGAEAYLQKNREDINQYQRQMLNISIGNDSIAYLIDQGNGLKYSKFYKAKFVKDNVYMHIYVSLPANSTQDLTGELQHYAGLAESKIG